MASHGPVWAAVLEEKAGQSCLHQAVLIPLRVNPDKLPHCVVKLLRELVFDRNKGGGVVWDLQHDGFGLGPPITPRQALIRQRLTREASPARRTAASTGPRALSGFGSCGFRLGSVAWRRVKGRAVFPIQNQKDQDEPRILSRRSVEKPTQSWG